METLVALIDRERLLAELVVFKLVELRQLLLAGEARFLAWASEEVERATASLHAAELERVALVAETAGRRDGRPAGPARGLPGGLSGARPAGGPRGAADPTLADLLEDAAEPWRTALAEGAEQLRRAYGEAAELTETVRRLADTGLRGVSDLLGRTAEPEPRDGLVLYGRTGRRDAAAPRPRVAQSL